MSEQQRVRAAEAYARALRTGEVSAARGAAAGLAEDVVCFTAGGEIKGHDAVAEHITGLWPSSMVYRMGGWSDPVAEGHTLVVTAEFPAYGAGVAGTFPGAEAPRMTVTFSFDDEDKIQTVTEVLPEDSHPEPQREIPLVVRGMINSALTNLTPICVAYVDADGVPEQSLRGSVQVYSPTQLSIWLRHAEGGFAKAIETNPNVSLLYRNSQTRSTLVIKGVGHIETDPAVRDRVYEISPEIEKTHDPDRRGAALVIDVKDLRGGTPRGGVIVQP